ncbi:metallophosphoesterase [Tengunoibacter tsumagoiensis]|uniref:Calcineurin-like phosphoesterase domain-containing protein n=1 Tax=Tengunoibacter tsumagoiensis TaxID=2014871 RepID=A0A402A770_9CHLR|nr:metallophosphoesterase [Tengunoibacter tsumagoiensis]GCE14987.1 hypothetical protein KTT_48460 [Tengunoibacter tsumagoiensis]
MHHPFVNPAVSLDALSAFAKHDQLELPTTYLAALDAVSNVLPQRGSLLELQDLPTIIIPDLHARREMLVTILGTRFSEGPLSGYSIFELLQQGRLQVVCVGDIVHSEKRDHWVVNLDGEWTPELLEREMTYSLGMGAMIMYLKICYPQHFHCLRGNHDDMAMEMGPYRKFVGLKCNDQKEVIEIDGKPVFTADKGESGIVKDWVLTREGWGETFLDAWTRFERALPLFAQGNYYVVTHTLPLIPLSRAELQNPERPREVVKELTSSRGIHPTALEETLDNLGIREKVQRWFYGHTPVPEKHNGGKYEEDLEGLLIRLNNPEKYVFAYVPIAKSEQPFVPTRDIYIKSPEEENTWHLTS